MIDSNRLPADVLSDSVLSTDFLKSFYTIRETLVAAQNRLNSDSPRLDAEVLLLHVLKKPRVYLYSHDDDLLTTGQRKSYAGLLEKRMRGEPIAHILQFREFWSLPLKVTADTLIPRPDTERLVELALSLTMPGQAKVLDLGAGSGAIACALASERKEWSVFAVEQRKAALTVLNQNVAALRLSNVVVQHSDWFEAVAHENFDMIVSNPPYLIDSDPHLSKGDLRFEPYSALASGPDGLRDIKHIAGRAKLYLRQRGWLLLEHGYDQGQAVRSLMRGEGYAEVVTEKDLGGNDRVTYGQVGH